LTEEARRAFAQTDSRKQIPPAVEFDFVTWSIWAVGFVIWGGWIVLSARELRALIRAQREDAEKKADASSEGAAGR
jgi:hypothetical protein